MILEYFMKNPHQVLNRTSLLDKLWEFDKISGEDTVKTHINNLRKKLKAVGASAKIIETVYAIGYRLGNS
jgi:DNA-binding response OmpR family regulator